MHLGKLGKVAESALPRLRAAAEDPDHEMLSRYAKAAISEIEQSAR
jgi:hypothetical protein